MPQYGADTGFDSSIEVDHTHVMSKRLQVLLDEGELREIRKIARSNNMTVAEWVRRALRKARRREPVRSADRKLAAVRAAVRHSYPAPDVDQMLDEIEQGYQSSMEPEAEET